MHYRKRSAKCTGAHWPTPVKRVIMGWPVRTDADARPHAEGAMVPRDTRTTPELSIEMRYPADERAPRAARQAVRDVCHDALNASMCDDAVLLTSELVTNACRVSGAAVTVTVALFADGVQVSVTDDDTDGVPRAIQPARLAESGRGLQLINTVAGAWGTDQVAAGKTVWFRLP